MVFEKIRKKKAYLLIICIILFCILLLVVLATNIIFNLNDYKYNHESYACCGDMTGIVPDGTHIPISPYAPCKCKKEDLSIIQKTCLVLGIKLAE